MNTSFYHGRLNLKINKIIKIAIILQRGEQNDMMYNIDINKMNQLMRENETARDIINQLLENQHSMVSTIAHEVRNPLTLIFSSLQVMQVQHPEVKEFPHWSQTLSDVEFTCQLLNELSALNNGNSLNYSVFSISRLLKNIAVSFAISLDSQNNSIEFTSSIPEDLDDFTGDKIKLEEVFLNLLKNARDAVGDSGRISLCVSQSEDSLIILVNDNGCGIPQDHLEDIFEPFKTYKTDGTGLGLALAKRIVESHGGSLSVSSIENTGSTFTVKLPR